MKLRVITRNPNGVELGAQGYPNLSVRYTANRKQKTASGTKLTNLVRTVVVNANVKATNCKDSCATEALSQRVSVSGSIQNSGKVAALQRLTAALDTALLASSVDGFAPLDEIEVDDELVTALFA